MRNPIKVNEFSGGRFSGGVTIRPIAEDAVWFRLTPIDESPRRRRSQRLHLSEREHEHASQKPAMAETVDLGLAIGAARVTHRHFDNLEVVLGRTEQQVEIAERVEVAENMTGLRRCAGNGSW